MTITRKIIPLSLLVLRAACGGPGDSATVPTAEPAGASSVDIGDHVVHFNALTTDQLPPEIARAYDLGRSKDVAMLNVSVIRKSDNAPVAAVVSFNTVNLTGQLKDVSMRQINEQEAIYYIGKTRVANRETLVFDISVKPEGEQRASEVRFKREFYTD